MIYQNILLSDDSCRHDYRYENIPIHLRAKQSFEGMPLVLHRNGTVCWDITDYCIERYLSINNPIKLSTLRDEARCLSRFVQFLDCKAKPMLLSQCTDKTLFEYVDYLLDDRQHKTIPQNNQVNKLLSRVLELFIWLKSRKFIDSNVISDSKDIEGQINVLYSEDHRKVRRKRYTGTRIFHEAMLEFREYVPRKPITDSVIDRLYEGIYCLSDNPIIHERWEVILETLEQTGVRVSELTSLTIDSVTSAYELLQNGSAPKLTVTTTKGKNRGQLRQIPVPKSTLIQLHNYLRFTRNPIVVRNIKSGMLSHEHKKLIINVDGTPMTPKHITRHFSDVRKCAKITEPASPHLFRHRYITKQVKFRLAKLLENTNNYCVGLESFVLHHVMRLTGHAHSDSLMVYVDLAMEEMDIFGEIKNQISDHFEDTSLLRKIKAIVNQEKHRDSSSETLRKVLALLERQAIK